MNNLSHLPFQIRVDSEGNPYSIIDGKVNNYEGRIRVEDIDTFLGETIPIPYPLRIAKFILQEMGKLKRKGSSLYNSLLEKL